MELRNKRTGEIIDDGYVRETHDFQFDGQKHVLAVFKGNGHSVPERISGPYNSLAELNEEWEDYEEPKTFFTIYYDGTISEFRDGDDEQIRDMKAIGNYFETKEEAEKAVEKLKAYKRLKDKGFELTGWKFTTDMRHTKGNFVTIKAEIPYIVENQEDLDLLFGGEK